MHDFNVPGLGYTKEVTSLYTTLLEFTNLVLLVVNSVIVSISHQNTTFASCTKVASNRSHQVTILEDFNGFSMDHHFCCEPRLVGWCTIGTRGRYTSSEDGNTIFHVTCLEAST